MLVLGDVAKYDKSRDSADRQPRSGVCRNAATRTPLPGQSLVRARQESAV